MTEQPISEGPSYSGKWDFNSDFDRRIAIQAEARSRWIPHVIWAVAIAIIAVAGFGAVRTVATTIAIQTVLPAAPAESGKTQERVCPDSGDDKEETL